MWNLRRGGSLRKVEMGGGVILISNGSFVPQDDVGEGGPCLWQIWLCQISTPRCFAQDDMEREGGF